MKKIIEALTDITPQGKKSRWPAKLDLLMSITGGIIGVFICFHFMFDASIWLGKNAMYSMTKAFELDFIFEGGLPAFVTVFAAAMFVLLLVHGILGVRKFPNSYKAFNKMQAHEKMMKHEDTSIWWFQFLSGIVIMFLTGMHLWTIMLEPADAGPYLSSYRIWTENVWLLYAVLIFVVVKHTFYGLYRVIVKWGLAEKCSFLIKKGVFKANDVKFNREKLAKIRNKVITFYLVVAYASLIHYMVIGYNYEQEQLTKNYKPNFATINGIKSAH